MNDMKFPRKVDSEIRVKLFRNGRKLTLAGEFQYSIWGLGRNEVLVGRNGTVDELKAAAMCL